MQTTKNILQKIQSPQDLRALTPDELEPLCAEIRAFLTEGAYGKEGHINSSLGVTELSVALHKVFNTPEDVLVWDVGHQAYVHKILTGRKDVFYTNRKKGGISGFTKIDESEYDAFGAGHSSTSISAICGFAEADKLLNKSRNYIAVIGDGALTGGMSFEALNYAGGKGLPLLVILNDNEKSIDDNVGYLSAKETYKEYFESLGFEYHFTRDGNHVTHLVHYLRELKDVSRPRVLHLKTQKGVLKKSASSKNNTFQDQFTDMLRDAITQNQRIVALSPAMLSGSGLSALQQEFPNHIFDTGITEQHVVTMAAGMAANGLKPVVHLYSTFAQRALDQIVHDVALQNLPVVFALDRSGVVGEDGATHHGVFDMSLLRAIPNLKIYTPFDALSFKEAFNSAFKAQHPVVIRYPKADILTLSPEINEVDYAVFRSGREADVAVITMGSTTALLEEACAKQNLSHFALKQIKPLPEASMTAFLQKYKKVHVFEEGSKIGGVGEAIQALGIGTTKVIVHAIDDNFVPHGNRDELLKDLGLTKFIYP